MDPPDDGPPSSRNSVNIGTPNSWSPRARAQDAYQPRMGSKADLAEALARRDERTLRPPFPAPVPNQS
jgi:hypothetical protein